MKNQIDELMLMAYQNKITDETFSRLTFLYENGFSNYNPKHSYIEFNLKQFLEISGGEQLNLELLEQLIILMVNSGICVVRVNVTSSVSLETKLFIFWVFNFFYYQNSYGDKTNPVLFKEIFESKFVPYKFDWSELCFDRELEIFAKIEN